MNKKTALKYLGYLLVIEGAFMLPAVLIAALYGEYTVLRAFLVTIAVLMALGIPMSVFRVKDPTLYAKDGFFIVAMSWIVLSLFGALPYRLSGAIPRYIDAFFETVSGFRRQVQAYLQM